LVSDDFKRIFIQPKSIIIGLVNQIILLPIVAFILVSLFPLQPEIAIGVMILAACPGGATSNLISHLAKADAALSVTLTAFSSFITIVTIPFIVNFSLEQFLSEGNMIQLNIKETFFKILFIIIIPVVFGMVIRKYKEAFALKMEKPVRIASALILALVIIGIIIKEKKSLVESFQKAGTVIVLLNIIIMLIGYYSAKLFRITSKRALSIAIESGIQNGTMGITIAVLLLGNPSYAIVSAVYGVLMLFTGAAAIYIGSRLHKKHP
jgi:BASS family bile acid:Na+ symporter